MECHNCQLFQRKFYCQDCIKVHLRETGSVLERALKDASKHVEYSVKELRAMNRAREIRAEIAASEERVTETRGQTQILRDANATTHGRISKLKASVMERRRNLATARGLQPPSFATTISTFNAKLSLLNENLSQARRIFVEELLDVFDIVEVGGRPSMGGTKGTKGEWMIGGLVLPVPGDMSRYPTEHINAALTYTLYFMNLLTFYLGVKLPFEVTWSGDAIGVGSPFIAAGKGPDTGGWARWSSKQPLHILTSFSSSSSHSPSSSPRVSSSSQAPFTTGLTMFIYNTMYLCHTQSLSIPLSQSGEILRNLWALCCCPELGCKSHQTGVGAALEAPTPPSFTLEFAQLLQVTSAGPGQRRKQHPNIKSLRNPSLDEEEGEWDIIEADL